MNDPAARGQAGTIRRLPPETVSRIASGEMILRPLSVAKELLENALDAEAGRIVLTVRDAADRFLSVSDDGCGMSEEECLLAIERHATSKIRDAEDLATVATLGFRGEALPSIARVSRMRIVSAPEGASGTEVLVRGGERETARPAPRSRGTTVEVEDLFFNAPVRKRFLRSPSAEVRLIHKLVASYALAFPQVDFRLLVDGKELLALPPGSPIERVEQIHGARFREKVLPLEGSHPRVELAGWVGIPELARAHTQGQTFLVNRRWVSHPPLSHALRQGFGDLLPPALQPFAILMMKVSGGALDVNVHPTKREIRFLEESLVYAETLRAVREATRRLVPGFSISDSATGSAVRLDPSGLSLGAAGVPGALFTRDGEDLERGGATPALVREGPAAAAAASAAPMVPLWQLQDRYIVAQTRQGILIVDQHAAHERVLYERALRSLGGGEAASQQLLFPAVVELSPDERALLERLAEDLARLGIHVEPFGQDAVILRSVPVNWEADPATMLRELLEDVSERTRRSEERTRALAASFACHGAIRSGTRLDLESMNRLIDELFSTELPHGDPHGRPTYLLLSIEELDRRFGRS